MRIVLQDDEGKQIDVIGGMNREILETWVDLIRTHVKEGMRAR